MKIYVFSSKAFKKVLGTFLIILCVITAFTVLLFRYDSSVVNLKKELPIYYVDTSEKKASITFDCAWGADDIPSILDTLKKENVKASFFFVGYWAEKYPDKVKMIANEGHDIANHSYSHLRMGVLDRGKISQEISQCGKVLTGISSKEVNLFRPPYGDYTDNVIVAARSLGYYPIQWDVDSLDWRPGISRDEILDRVMRRVQKGSIILFHNDTPHTANMLPGIISSLKKEGYTLVPVSELIYKGDYILDVDGKQMMKQ